MKKKIYLIIVLAICMLCGVQNVEAKQGNLEVIGKYTFDTDMYISRNKTSPIMDFGSQFGAFEPHLELKDDGKISYYFSFEGGKGEYSIRDNIIASTINNPNSGIVKEKMKIKTIQGNTYIVQSMYGKKIYWKKETSKKSEGSSSVWYGASLDYKNKQKNNGAGIYKGSISSTKLIVYGRIDRANIQSDLWNEEKRITLSKKKYVYRIAKSCKYYVMEENGDISISRKEFQNMFKNCLKKNSSGAGLYLTYKVKKGKIVKMELTS